MIVLSIDSGVIELSFDSGVIEFTDNEDFTTQPGLLNLDGSQLFNLDGTPLYNLT